MKQAAGNRQSHETSVAGKIIFLGKLVVFLVSFGFVYPTLFSD